MRKVAVYMVLLLAFGGCRDTTVIATGFSPVDTNAIGDAVDSATNNDTVDDGLDTESDSANPDTDTFATDAVPGLLGFGAADALSQDGTTGGGDAPPVRVTTGEQMQNAVDTKGDDPLVIHVEGRLTHTTGRVLLAGVSDISIIGINADAELDGFGISLSGASNIIIQNLTIHHVADADRDGIRITNQSHHVWVDHCRLYNDPTDPLSETPYDSLLDISRGSDYITVSWCHFKDHVKALYIGHSDTNDAQDAGTLRTTWHHNIFTNISATVLSVRFGTAHLFNNRFESIPYIGGNTGVGVSSRMTACVQLERNQFLDVFEPVKTDQSGSDLVSLGSVALLGNDFQNPTLIATTPTCTPAISYDYTHALNSTSSLETILGLNVGPR